MERNEVKLLVCGGRDYSDKEYLTIYLNYIHKTCAITTLIHGDADGADKLAGEWAEERGIKVIAVPAEWDKYGKAAGYKRNVKMADMKPDVVIAFRGGRGTQMMKQIARDRKIRVVEAGYV